MPLDLASYTKGVRAALDRLGLACVFVAQVKGKEISKIGFSGDLAASFQRLQRSSPDDLEASAALWVPDQGIAKNISQATQCDLVAHKRAGGWLSIDADTATRALEMVAFRIHPGATMMWHEELVAKLAAGVK